MKLLFILITWGLGALASSFAHAEMQTQESTLLFHWGPIAHVEQKLQTGQYDFGKPFFGDRLSDGHSPAWDLQPWLNWARTRFYDQKQGNWAFSNKTNQGFKEGPGYYTCNHFITFLLGSNINSETLLVFEVRYFPGHSPLTHAPLASGGEFSLAKDQPYRRLGIEARIPLIATDTSHATYVIYRSPNSLEHSSDGIEIVYRPPNSDDVRRIWEQESKTPDDALKLLTQLVKIRVPGIFGLIPYSLALGRSKSTDIVIDQLFYDWGYDYLTQTLTQHPEFFANQKMRATVNQLILAYERSLGIKHVKADSLRQLFISRLAPLPDQKCSDYF